MKSNRWESVSINLENEKVSKPLIQKLISNEIACIRVPDIYNTSEIQKIVNNIKHHGINWYPNFEFKQGRIGIAATEYASKIHGKEIYFLMCEEAKKNREKIFTKRLSALKKIQDVFSPAYDISIAKEGDREYFSGLIRAMKVESTLHYDLASEQLPGWGVANSTEQLAVVIYLQVPEEGGEITVYNRKAGRDDEVYNKDKIEKGPLGFEDKFLEGVHSLKISPYCGEMIIFNSHNFHKVEAINSETTRLSVNSFLSLEKGRFSIWN